MALRVLAPAFLVPGEVQGHLGFSVEPSLSTLFANLISFAPICSDSHNRASPGPFKFVSPGPPGHGDIRLGDAEPLVFFLPLSLISPPPAPPPPPCPQPTIATSQASCQVQLPEQKHSREEAGESSEWGVKQKRDWG